MVLFYYIWLFFYTYVCKHSTLLERIIFLNDYISFYKNNSIYKVSYFQKYFLIFFYTPLNLKKVTIFFRDMDKIYALRIHKYTQINNFFAKNINTENTNVRKKKYIYSMIKANACSNERNSYDFIFFCSNLFLIKSASYVMFWKHFVPKLNFKEYLSSKNSFELINNRNVSGFFNFLSDDMDIITFNKLKQNDKFHSNYVNIRKSPYKVNNVKVVKKNFLKILEKYNKFYFQFKNEEKLLSFFDVFSYFLKKEKFQIELYFNTFYKTMYPIKYKPTDVSQYLYGSQKVLTMFLRKNKIFNKGRYSRNRQLYRTGVYWCLILNILNVFGLYYYFYRFVFNFGYFYLPLLILILSIFGGRLIKYRFYNPIVILNEFKLFLQICIAFIFEIVFNFFLKLKFLFIKVCKYSYSYLIVLFS